MEDGEVAWEDIMSSFKNPHRISALLQRSLRGKATHHGEQPSPTTNQL